MIGEILHIGLTVTDLDKSIDFYKNVLGLKFLGELIMEGREADILFGRRNSRARIGYFNGGTLKAPPIELIQFTDIEVERQEADLFRTSASEICLFTDDIWKAYRELSAKGVSFISEPQDFDFTKHGFGKSRAVYFKDPDGIILELIQNVE